MDHKRAEKIAASLRVRLSCPSFLYRLYVPEERRDEIINRVKRRETVCTRPRRLQ